MRAAGTPPLPYTFATGQRKGSRETRTGLRARSCSKPCFGRGLGEGDGFRRGLVFAVRRVRDVASVRGQKGVEG
jgi:hypothetical protein